MTCVRGHGRGVAGGCGITCVRGHDGGVAGGVEQHVLGGMAGVWQVWNSMCWGA